MHEAHAEDHGHGAQIVIVFRNIDDTIRCRDGVALGADEGIRSDQEMIVVNEADRVSFTGQEDMKDVHDVGIIGRVTVFF